MKKILPFIVAAGASAPVLAQNPNIVVIISDQQQAGKIAAYGDMNIHTPALDFLVEQGYSYMNARCAFPLSAPQRFSMITGMYPSSAGFRFNTRKKEDVDRLDWNLINSRMESTLGHHFRANGYQTWYGGKLDVPSQDNRLDPSVYGFDVYSTDERNQLAYDFIDCLENKVTDDKPFLMVASFLNPHDICLFDAAINLKDYDHQYRRSGWSGNSLVAPTRAINQAAQYSTQEFYSSIAPLMPQNSGVTENAPECLTHTEPYNEDTWRLYRWVYDRMADELDISLSPIVRFLRENGYLENTIIVFLSDHGEMAGSHGLMHKNHPYEEAQRVPLIICGKGVLQGVRDETTQVNTGVDLLPTLCDIAGIDAPEGLAGKSVFPPAKGDGYKQGKYKFYEGPDWFQVIENGRYKYTVYDDPAQIPMLIDLSEDPGEMHNLYGRSATASIQKKLDKVLRSHLGH